MAILNTTFIGEGGSMEIGDITSKNKSGDSNYALCNGKTIYYPYYPELYNNNYMMQDLLTGGTAAWVQSSTQSIVNSKGYSDGYFRCVDNYYIVSYSYNSSGSYVTKTQLVPIDDILSASSGGDNVYTNIRKFKNLWISSSGEGTSEKNKVYYRETLTGTDTQVAIHIYDRYILALLNTNDAVLVKYSSDSSGSSSELTYSSNGKEYTNITDPLLSQINNDTGKIDSNGTYFLSVLPNSNTAYYSTDAVNWESTTLPITMPYSISTSNYFAYEGAFLIYGSNNIVYASKDCVNWCQIGEVNKFIPWTINQTMQGRSTTPDESNFYGLSYCNGKYFIRASTGVVWTEDFATLHNCEHFVTAYFAGNYYSERGYISNDLLNWTAPSRTGFRLGVYNSEGILFAFDYSTYTGTAQSQTRGTWYYSIDGTTWVRYGVTSGSAPFRCDAAGSYIFTIYQDSSSYKTVYRKILYTFPNYAKPRYMKVK